MQGKRASVFRIVHTMFRFLLFSQLLFPFPLMAKEVVLPYQGVSLNANLEIAANGKLSNGVIVITHAGLAHRGMELYVYLQSLLKERGYNSLAINFSLGINNRHGMYDCKVTHRHRYHDAVGEISAWLTWLEHQGVKRVTLLGHSRGAAQTALFAVEQDSNLLNSVILMAPDTQATNDSVAYQHRHKKPLATVLARAQRLVASGKGSDVLDHTGILYCMDTSVAAETIVSYYGPDPRLDTPFLIPKINKPTLIIVAGSDEIVVGFKEKFKSLANGNRVQLKIIDGAGHFFRDLNADDAVDVIDVFLRDMGFIVNR